MMVRGIYVLNGGQVLAQICGGEEGAMSTRLD